MNHLKILAAATTTVLALNSFPLSASASEGSSINFHLSAHVDVFCQISPPENDEISIVGGAGRIGMVRELCNTPSGYVVTTQFTNLSGGVLEAAGRDVDVDTAGQAVRMNDQAAMINSAWMLSKAVTVQPDQPVFMRVTIAPR